MLNASAVGGMGCPTAALGQDSPREGIRAEQDVKTRSVSLEQLPNTSLSLRPGFAGEHWLQDNHGGLAPGRSREETSQAINCFTEHLGEYQSLWESLWEHWEGTARERVLQERYPVPPAKHAQALNSTCPQHLPGLDLCLEGSPLARL